MPDGDDVMICETCKAQLSDYLDGQLHSAQRADFEAHVRMCPECAAIVRNVRTVRSRLTRLERQRLPDEFNFRMRRLLIAEAERERSRSRRFWEIFVPTPQFARAAMIGTAAAVVSFVALWTWWSPGGFPGDVRSASTAGVAEAPESQSVRYVLDNVDLEGEPIESTVSADTVAGSRQDRIAVPDGAQPVSASF